MLSSVACLLAVGPILPSYSFFSNAASKASLCQHTEAAITQTQLTTMINPVQTQSQVQLHILVAHTRGDAGMKCTK